MRGPASVASEYSVPIRTAARISTPDGDYSNDEATFEILIVERAPAGGSNGSSGGGSGACWLFLALALATRRVRCTTKR